MPGNHLERLNMLDAIETFINDYPLIAIAIAVITAALVIALILALIKKVTSKLIWLLIALTIGVPATPLILAGSFLQP